MQRRHFLLGAGATSLAGVLAACGGGGSSADGSIDEGALAQDSGGARGESGGSTSGSTGSFAAPAVPKAHVIVVGGGMGGATVAKYLRMWGDAVAVTLVERNPGYTACLLSSLVLTGQRSLANLSFSYDALRTRYGVNVVQGEVVGIEPDLARVTLSDGRVLSGDRVVLSPGIDFDAVPGLTEADALRMPHAWKAGPQTTTLAQQLAAMPSGGTVILTVPKAPYRCPPGPYERSCLLADWLKRRKPGAKLIVLDANPDIVAERDNFMNAFLGLHASVIDYHTGVQIDHVDPATMQVFTQGGSFRGDVVNLIPSQRAGAMVAAAGLANGPEGRCAAVDVLSYASTVAPRVHVIGDASATTQPKSGHMANQQAKTCADAMVRAFAGQAPDPQPVTSSACYSTITMTQASWLSAAFQYDAAKGVMVPVAAAGMASPGWSTDNFADMGTWFRSITSDSFA